MTTFNTLDGALFQWDTGRRIQIIPAYGTTLNEVHFANSQTPLALIKIPEEDGIVGIPDVLLQTSGRVAVYAVYTDSDGRRTVDSTRIRVLAREKPDDYVYTEEELLTYKALEKRLDALEKDGTAAPAPTINVTDDGAGTVSLAIEQNGASAGVIVTDDGAGTVNFTIGG